MTAWYCSKCRMSFRVDNPTSHSERCGCPTCGLWFHTGTTNGHRANVTVSPDDLAKHKARQTVRPSVHESYEPPT